MGVSLTSSLCLSKYSGPFFRWIDWNATHVECDHIKGATQMTSNQNWINSNECHPSVITCRHYIVWSIAVTDAIHRTISFFLFVHERARAQLIFYESREKPRWVAQAQWMAIAWRLCAHFVLHSNSISHRFGHGYERVMGVLTMATQSMTTMEILYCNRKCPNRRLFVRSSRTARGTTDECMTCMREAMKLEIHRRYDCGQ